MLAYLGLGSNIGDGRENLDRAVARLAEAGELKAVSPYYRTEPLDGAAGKDFTNAVVALETEMTAQEVHRFSKEAEWQLGRRPAKRNSARIIDIDLLVYDETELDEPDLKLPHPRMRERLFVVRPLLDLAPEFVLPDGTPLQSLLAGLQGQRVEELPA